MDLALTMYQLQQAELERAECIRRRVLVDASLKDSSELEAAGEADEKARAVTAKAEAKMRDLELTAQSVHAKLRATEERMFSGRVSNPKELSSLQSESESLKRRIAKAEDDLLEAMIALDEARERAASAGRTLSEATAEHEKRMQDLHAEREQLDGRLSKLDASIQSMRASLEPQDLRTFDDLTRRKAGRPVAVLNRNNVCGGCGVSVPLMIAQQARARTGLAFCPTCERILCTQT
jgi:predicted  nucleic acid-binding Zn-ribbon protein